MKKIEQILFVSILTLFSFSCSGDMEPNKKNAVQPEVNDNENTNEKEEEEEGRGEPGKPEYVIGPFIAIEYIDKNNNCLIHSLEIDESATPIIVRDKKIFELLSITDEKGNIFISDKVTTGRNEHAALGFHIPESFTPGSNIMRQYTVKYKIPPILGKDKVEELNLTFNTDELNNFTTVVYNNKEIKLIDLSPILANLSGNENEIDWSAVEKEMNDALYCGDTIANIEGSGVLLIIPVDK